MKLAPSLEICASGWLLPGIGHIALRLWGRGIAFMLAVMLMFVLGGGRQGKLYGLTPEQPLHIFAFIANMGVGIPYIIAQRLGFGTGVISAPSYDYGDTYLWVSGLLNYLVVLDVFDVARGRKP